VNKIRTDIATKRPKLNAPVRIKNLRNMHEKSLPRRPTSTGASLRMRIIVQRIHDPWNCKIRTGPACKVGDHTQADAAAAAAPPSGMVNVVEPCDGTGTRDWPLPGPIQELAPDP
jgi:hypothetical protein